MRFFSLCQEEVTAGGSDQVLRAESLHFHKNGCGSVIYRAREPALKIPAIPMGQILCKQIEREGNPSFSSSCLVWGDSAPVKGAACVLSSSCPTPRARQVQVAEGKSNLALFITSYHGNWRSRINADRTGELSAVPERQMNSLGYSVPKKYKRS